MTPRMHTAPDDGPHALICREAGGPSLYAYAAAPRLRRDMYVPIYREATGVRCPFHIDGAAQVRHIQIVVLDGQFSDLSGDADVRLTFVTDMTVDGLWH